MKHYITLTIVLTLILTAFGMAEGVDPVQTFSEDNRLIQEDYIDESGQRILSPNGYSRRVMTYDAGGHELRHGREAVAQLHVGGGVGHHAHAVLGQNRAVGLAHADAVRRDGGRLEDARVAHVLNRRAVVLGPHVVRL